jgi:hypothetical protein
VLADHEPVLLGLGQRREDACLRGAGIREEVLDPRVCSSSMPPVPVIVLRMSPSLSCVVVRVQERT